MPLSEWLPMLGTAVAVGAGMAPVLLFFTRAVFARDIKPLETALHAANTAAQLLGQSFDTLTAELREQKETQRADRKDMHDAVEKLTEIASDHERRVLVLEVTAQKTRDSR